ncbi:MAG: hypothetical protein ACOCXJ_02185, partial [Planctomycetota bacterium]
MIIPQTFRAKSLALDLDDLPPIEAENEQAPEYETSIRPVPMEAETRNENEQAGPATRRLARNQLQRMVTGVLDQLLKRRGLPLPTEQREHLVHQARSILDAALNPEEAQDIGIRRFRRLIDAMRDELDELRQQMAVSEEREAENEEQLAERAALCQQLHRTRKSLGIERDTRLRHEHQNRQLHERLASQDQMVQAEVSLVLERFDTFLGTDLQR